MTGYVLAGLALAALIAVLVWQWPWRRKADDLVAMRAWLEDFSPDSYLPMLRLADSRDSLFLAVHKGSDEALRYRRMQRRFLKQYLRALARDVHRLHVLVAETALCARHDRENSSLTPLDEKMEFAFSLWHIELCLFFDRWRPCRADLRPLLANVGKLVVRASESGRRCLEFRVS